MEQTLWKTYFLKVYKLLFTAHLELHLTTSELSICLCAYLLLLQMLYGCILGQVL